MEKVWKMNATQRAFVNEVKMAGKDGVTIFELKVQGKAFATGAINPLVGKGILATLPEKREFVCDVVFNGVKVGEARKAGVVFVMAEGADDLIAKMDAE